MKKSLYFCSLIFLLAAAKSNASDTLVTKNITPGCKYFQIKDSSMNVVIDLLEVDLDNENIDISMGISHDVLNEGGETVADYVKRKRDEGLNIAAAVNADFFGNVPMQAQNSMIMDGKIIKGVNLNRGSIAFTDSDRPHIGKFPFYGILIINDDTVSIDAINSFDTTKSVVIYNPYWRGKLPLTTSGENIILQIQPDLQPGVIYESSDFVVMNGQDSVVLNTNQLFLRSREKLKIYENNDTLKFILNYKNIPENVRTLIGGLPTLFVNNILPESYVGIEGLASEKFLGKNPRTALGYNKEKTKLFIAVVDGRQPEYSMGMTMNELAEFMRSLGCYDALNFDGGGSTTMTIRDEVVNSPSDFAGSRAVYNYLLIISHESVD